MDISAPKDCHVHFCTVESVKLRTLFDLLSTLLNNGNLRFDKDGITLLATPCGHEVIVHVRIDASNVQEYSFDYNVNGDNQLVVGIDFKRLLVACRDVSANDLLMLQVTRATMSTLRPSLSVITASTRSWDVADVAMMDIGKDMITLPPQTFNTVIRLDSQKLQRTIRRHTKNVEGQGGDSIQILAVVNETGTYIVFVSDGTQSAITTTYQTELCTDAQDEKCKEEEKTYDVKHDESRLRIDVLHKSADKRERYSLKTLAMLCKSANMSNYVKIYLSPGKPLTLSYRIGTIGAVTFMVPQIDDHQDEAPGSESGGASATDPARPPQPPTSAIHSEATLDEIETSIRRGKEEMKARLTSYIVKQEEDQVSMKPKSRPRKSKRCPVKSVSSIRTALLPPSPASAPLSSSEAVPVSEASDKAAPVLVPETPTPTPTPAPATKSMKRPVGVKRRRQCIEEAKTRAKPKSDEPSVTATATDTATVGSALTPAPAPAPVPVPAPAPAAAAKVVASKPQGDPVFKAVPHPSTFIPEALPKSTSKSIMDHGPPRRHLNVLVLNGGRLGVAKIDASTVSSSSSARNSKKRRTIR